MINRIFHFEFSELNLSVKQIEEVIGYGTGASSGAISDMISEALDAASTICSVKAEYKIFPEISFNDTGKSVNINEVSFNINKIVYHQLVKSSSLAVFLCTAGHEIGDAAKKAMKDGDMLKGYLFDIIGSEIVEASTDLMQSEIEREMKESGKKITNRYSPGYCGWNVVDQHKLFTLMPDNHCGIRLNESALMDPIKSVSGFIGVGEKVKFYPYTCNLCDMKDCIYRNKRTKLTPAG
jgi:hypothetical protein